MTPTPDKPAGEALKALDPLYCSHPGPCEDNYRDNGGCFCANGDAFTPPPSALDEAVVAVLEKLLAICPSKSVEDARAYLSAHALLTRLKDSK